MSEKEQKSWTIAEKQKKLRKNQLARKVTTHDGYGRNGINEVDIKHIEPVSDLLKSISNAQQRILNWHSRTFGIRVENIPYK